MDHFGRDPAVVSSANRVTGAVTGASVQSGVIHGDVTIQQTAPTPPPPVPRQLPPVPAHFIARPAEMSALDRVAETGTGQGGVPGVAMVAGPGGVGKTALAVAWATINADRFPDGQLYADLRGFSTGSAVTPEEVLGRFLRSVGVPPERVPVELAEQAALFRTMTAGKRLLVLADNALSTAQVRPLMPASPECVVLVTSRLRLDGLYADGAEFVDVSPLPQGRAVELLTRSLGPRRAAGEGPQLGELASLCGRLPIALRVACARLVSRPRWPVERVVAELKDERQRLQRLSAGEEMSVDAAFDLSYQALPDETARLYRLASEHPASEFEAGVAAAAARMPEDEAIDGLQALVDASLLEELGGDHYRFHDLLRLHARAQPDEDREAARLRVAHWFLHRTTRANMVVIPLRWRVSDVCERYRDAPAMFRSGGEALDWLDGQLPNLLAVLEDTVSMGQDELAWQLCEALWELFLHRKHYHHWLSSHELGIAAARRCGHEVAESRLRCQLARAYLDLRRFDEAERECLTAAELARRNGSKHNESVAMNQLGMAAQGREDIGAALVYFGKSLVLEQELGIERGVANRHRRIGEALLRAGRDAEAAGHFASAVAIYARLGDTKDEAKVLIGLARIDARAGALDPARQRLERAQDVLSTSGSAVYQADVLIAFAEIAEDNGDPASARTHLRQALRLCDGVSAAYVERIQTALTRLATAEDD
ncbi:tetratricopeptide repeat protein [Amycolatopsis sp. NPDC059021]|uniref:tetratricopeptide repeat protein n=1 Tax=Amycolatopsis sp. NPDC059021 TaxID=3346704 RepID=UPI0036734A8A